ncbi:MAG: outer membrane beta-barrel protein [Flavisolibacter sp.]|nr:outer membrane beta-barrel protein [Flavisolibacter sp.]
MTKFRNLFAALTFSNTYNKIVDSVLQRGFGQQYGIPEGGGNQLVIPANMNGLYSITGSVNFGFPIKRMKGGNFNATTRINYNRNGNYTNSIKNYIKNLTLGEDVRLSYNYKEELDLGIGGSISYTSAQYTIQQNRNTSYYTHIYSADVTYQLPKNFILSSDVDFTTNTGRSDGFNQSYFIWNASFAKQLFKNKRGELKLSVNDILNQNQSVSRNVGENYVEDVQNNILRRYFMLSFTYHLNRMGNRNIQQMPRMMDRSVRSFRMGQ